MDIRRLTTETRDVAIAAARRFASDWWAELGSTANPTPVSDTDNLAVAVLSLLDGREIVLQALHNARRQIHATGSSTDDVHVAVIAEIDHAEARLQGALPRRLEPETMGSTLRARVTMRALDVAGATIDAMPADVRDAVEPPPLESLTDQQVLAVALELCAERLVAQTSQPRKSRCSWCVVAAGDRGKVEPMPHDAAAAHVLECPHSPGAAAFRTLRRMLEINGASGGWQELIQTMRRGMVEAENLRLAAIGGQVHESDCPDPLSPHATCLDDGPHPPTPPRTDAVTGEPVAELTPRRMMVSRVGECPRCGGTHEELTATAFARPVDVPEAGGVLWTHWATCPTTGDPIMIQAGESLPLRLTDDVVEGLKRFADVAHVEGQIDPNPPLTGDRSTELAAAAWLESRGWRRDS